MNLYNWLHKANLNIKDGAWIYICLSELFFYAMYFSLPCFLNYSIFDVYGVWHWSHAGPIFTYSTGNVQLLCITDPEMVKYISLCTSLSLGRPSFASKDRRPLFGEGILSSNGSVWAYQKKIIAPELYMDKVKVFSCYLP